MVGPDLPPSAFSGSITEAHGYGWVQVELRGLELQENFFGLAIGGNATCVVHGRCSHFFAYLSLA